MSPGKTAGGGHYDFHFDHGALYRLSGILKSMQIGRQERLPPVEVSGYSHDMNAGRANHPNHVDSEPRWPLITVGAVIALLLWLISWLVPA